MSSLENLKSASSRSDLARLLGYKPKSLSFILFKIKDKDKYTTFSIPKKNGGQRNIHAPEERLKSVQRRLSDLLTRCLDEINKKGEAKGTLSHGFRKKHSIITNADKHKNKRYVFNIDLENFFPSINFGRVLGFFVKNAHFSLQYEVATTIAQIACHNGVLPQGSPCSPVISNLIGHILDVRMVGLAKKAKCTYSRYVDDLTFSTNQRSFPPKVAKNVNGCQSDWVPGRDLEREIQRTGFKINCKKVSMQHKTSRQVATGLIVNEEVNIKREYYKKARSMCNSLFKTGSFYIEQKPTKSATTKSITPVPGTLNQLDGILGFIYHVKTHESRIKAYERGEVNLKNSKIGGIIKLCKYFLFYRYFFSTDMPLIICEGKTDLIYLRCALKQLAHKYPELIGKDGNNHKFHVRFFNPSKRSRSILNLAEGTSGLAYLIGKYKSYAEIFLGAEKKHPVIMLVDNDDGAKDIKNKLGGNDFNQPFIHHTENLYIVATPLVSGKTKTAIEDMFDSQTLGKIIEGKTFNPNENTFSAEKNYQKYIFAKKVILPNQNNINFHQFEDIFSRFLQVIEDYKGKRPKNV